MNTKSTEKQIETKHKRTHNVANKIALLSIVTGSTAHRI